jgi:hypothetical protein
MGSVMPTFETSGPIELHVEVAIGEARLRAGDHADTTIAVRPSDPDRPEDVSAAERTVIERDDQKIKIRTPKLGLINRKGGSVDVTIALPAGSQVAATGQTADLVAEGRLGPTRVTVGLGSVTLGETGDLALKCGLGDIVVGHVTGHASVTAGSGDVRIDALDRSATVKAGNGDTWLGAVGGDLQVKTANGDVRVASAHGSVTAKTASGDLRVDRADRGSLDLQTSAGDIEVGIPAGTAAYLDVNARYGHFDNQLQASGAPASGATVEVRARTTAGNIAVRRPVGAEPVAR